MSEGNGHPPSLRCPVCGKDSWAQTPTTVFLPASGMPPESGTGLHVQPHVCVCGYVAFMAAETHTSS